MSRVRTFIAVAVPARRGLLAGLGDLRRMGRALRVPPAENLHFTLRFLGDVESEALPSIAGAIGEAVVDRPGFEVVLKGVGVFPNERRPTVVWAGVEDGSAMVELADCVNGGLGTLGYEAESRPFQPHLTLARVKFRPPRAFAGFLEANRETVFGGIAVKEVDVMTSVLGPGGPRYSVVSSVRLGRKAE